jgi:hypothetical protein
VLDLYARQRQGTALQEDEFVISADEKTSIQARRRNLAGTLPCVLSMNTSVAAPGLYRGAGRSQRQSLVAANRGIGSHGLTGQTSAGAWTTLPYKSRMNPQERLRRRLREVAATGIRCG